MDTDACSINNNKIIKDSKIGYIKDEYHVPEPENIINRYKQKLPIIKKLSKLNCITFAKLDNLVKPYCAYYMSCNLEHVLHGDPNVFDVEAKEYYSMKFAIKYEKKLTDFIAFINADGIGTKLNQNDSWNNILSDIHATMRETNLNLFINDFLKKE